MKHAILKFCLGRWFFAVYFLLGVIYFGLFMFVIPGSDLPGSFFATLALLTGGDPFSFSTNIQPHMAIWCLAWVIHVGSWLIMPALVGLLINDAAKHLSDLNRLEVNLAYLAGESGVAPAEVADFIASVKQDIEKWVSDPDRETRHGGTTDDSR